jgi:MFS family permease
MNKNLWLLTIAQGLFLTNNVTFIAINGLVGLSLAPVPWMATLPVMGYVVGGALSTGLVAKSQQRFGRKGSFLLGLLVALLSAGIGAWAVMHGSFFLLVLATLVAGYYSANGQLYRFAAAELAPPAFKEKAVSWVLAGGILGAVLGPNMANWTKNLLSVPYMGVYFSLAIVALLGIVAMQGIEFPPEAAKKADEPAARSMREIFGQRVFLVSVICAAAGYGIMNLLMAATPLAMDVCGFAFHDTAFVLEWHVIGMFAPGFYTGDLIKRFGAFKVMVVGVLLNFACVAIAISGQSLYYFVAALLTLGVGWNFLFTGATTMAISLFSAQEKNKAQASINFCVFATMAVTSLSSGALVTTAGWSLLNMGSLVLVGAMAASLLWLKSDSTDKPAKA